jgi:hypothetical protein
VHQRGSGPNLLVVKCHDIVDRIMCQDIVDNVL